MKYLLLLVSVLTFQTSIAQGTSNIFTVDIFIDSDAQVYLENKSIDSGNIEQEMSDYVFEKNAYYDDNVLYRIYADRNLQLGLIMNINNQLIKAFHPSNTRTERYLLNAKELDVNASNWQNSVQKLNLKAVEN